MKKLNLKEVRTIFMINFIAEILVIINLYLSNIHTMKILKFNVLAIIAIVFNIIGLLFIFKLTKNFKNNRLIITISLILDLLCVIFGFLMKSNLIIVLSQIMSDILKFIVMLDIYKVVNKKNKNALKNKFILTVIVSYLATRICYLLITILNGITIKPIVSTIYIIGVVVVYSIFIKSLEKK